MSNEWILEHVIAGTDYSDSSRGAVGEALRLGGRFGSTVSIVHVATTAKTVGKIGKMDKFLAGEDVPDNINLQKVIVESGKVAEALGDYADEHSVDLLVVGPRARTFVERHIVGSIAEQLFSRTSVPTLATAGVSEGYRKVLVALDDSEAAAAALRIGARLMRYDIADAQLIAFHALSSRGASAIHNVDEAREIEKALVEDAADQIGDLLANNTPHLQGSQRRVDVRIGTLGSQLPKAVADLKPDLVCMGTVGRKGVVGLLAGNAADRMVRALEIPLLVAHP